MTHQEKKPFSERHPKLNLLVNLIVVIISLAVVAMVVYYFFKYIGTGISKITDWLATTASKLDAVVIVALITGAVSITGVIISSIISKVIEFRKARKEYLAKKREEPYTDFIDMVYKIQQNTKKREFIYRAKHDSRYYRFFKEPNTLGVIQSGKKVGEVSRKRHESKSRKRKPLFT